MRRVIVLEANAVEEPLYKPYAVNAYNQSVPRWRGDHMALNQIPTQEDILSFAMAASADQSRLYSAQTVSKLPPTSQQILSGIFHSQSPRLARRRLRGERA